MQKIIATLLLFSSLQANTQNVGIGTTTPAASAQLEISSSTKGFLIPRMTTSQRNAIASPAVGLQIFNLDDQCTDIYDGTNWIKNCGLKIASITTDPGHPTPDSWTQKALFGSTPRVGAVSFSIGPRGYIGTGDEGFGGTVKNDFWEYNPLNNVWTQKANFGGPARRNAVGFSIDNKGYIGTGGGYSDFWEYDPNTNTWVQKANFGGTGRSHAVGFSIGSKGYIGTGNDGFYRNDFWEYDPAGNAWTPKADFAGVARFYAVGFGIGNKGYLGIGSDGATRKNDLWEYDPATNVWTAKANFPSAIGREAAVGFSIGSKGYIGTGYEGGSSVMDDFWEYNPVTNTWALKAYFGPGSRLGATGFGMGNKGYIGTGSFKNDFWEYMDSNQVISYASANPVPPYYTISDNGWALANGILYNINKFNVGIGTSNPVNKLSVAGNADITGKVGIGITNPVNKLSVDGNVDFTGNVGIGTSNPDAKLHVIGNISTTTLTAGSLNTAGIVTNNAIGLLGTTSIVPIANGGTGTNTTFTEGSVLFAGINGGYAQNNANIFWNNTNARLGVGTSAPMQTLDVNGGLRVANGVIQNGNTAVTGTVDLGLYSQTVNSTLRFVTNNGRHVFYTENGINGAGTSPKMILLQNGNVGIGTTAPFNKLEIAGGLAVGASFAGTLVAAPVNGAVIEGRVGIGTNNPDAPLQINGNSITTASFARSLFAQSASQTAISNGIGASGTIQVHANGWYWADGGGFVATSDARIKNIIGLSNTEGDLATLNKIEITDYKYKDEYSLGSGLQKKVIAQQLKTVYPTAVNTNKGTIPSIFERAVSVVISGTQTTITTGKPHGLVTGNLVKLVLENGGEKTLLVSLEDERSFKVNEAITEKVFVYGQQVNDLLNVDYDAISMLNVSATQQLSKQVMELQKETAEYKARLLALEEKLNSILQLKTSKIQ